MNKKCYILNTDAGAGGVVKLEKGFADVDIKMNKAASGNEILDVYAVADEKLCHIGSMTGAREKFICRKPETLNGVIITRAGKIEFWGGKENIKQTAEKLFYPEKEISEFFPRELTPETYFGGGFKWKRINGYYSVYKYSIVMHTLSLESVKQTIEKRGYYLLGVKKGEGIHISVALPQMGEEETLFGELDEYSYSMNYRGKSFRALCLAIDDSGEYFLY